MRTLGKELGIDRMALPAHVRHRAHPGRSRAVVAVAVVARRRAPSAPLQQEPSVNALPVLLELVRRERAAGHVVGVAVAPGARLRHVRRIDPRPRVTRGQHAVHVVAVHAGRHFFVALLEPLAVPAGPVELELVHPHAGIVPAHEARVGVAAPAEPRNLLPFRHAHVPGVGVHRHVTVHARRVPAVTVCAGEPLAGVDVVGHLGRRGPQRLLLQLEVAGPAGVLLCRGNGRQEESADRREDAPRHTRHLVHSR